MRHFIQLSCLCLLGSGFMIGCQSLHSQHSYQKKVKIHAVSTQGIGQKIGTVRLEDSAQGLVITAHLSKLPSGEHGFHIHENGSCQAAERNGKLGAAYAAGNHFNPDHAKYHGTALTGHLGDLPALQVDSNGNVNQSIIAPRLKLSDIQGLAIIVNAGEDNYADTATLSSRGREHIACGVIP